MQRLAISVIGAVCLCALTPVTAQSDVAALVAAARQALGGDAALYSIKSLSISGSLSRRSRAGISERLEISYVAPDRFLRVSEWAPMTSYQGFDGAEPLNETVWSDSGLPVTNTSLTSAEEIMMFRSRQLESAHQTFLQVVLPLFIVLPPQYGAQLSSGGRVKVDNAEADAIDIRRASGITWRLLIDAATHLPIRLTWRARPGDRPPGFADVDWVMTIRDYKVDALTWPRRLTTSFDGKEWEDVRISRYRLNPRIDARVFERWK